MYANFRATSKDDSSWVMPSFLRQLYDIHNGNSRYAINNTLKC